MKQYNVYFFTNGNIGQNPKIGDNMTLSILDTGSNSIFGKINARLFKHKTKKHLSKLILENNDSMQNNLFSDKKIKDNFSVNFLLFSINNKEWIKSGFYHIDITENLNKFLSKSNVEWHEYMFFKLFGIIERGRRINNKKIKINIFWESNNIDLNLKEKIINNIIFKLGNNKNYIVSFKMNKWNNIHNFYKVLSSLLGNISHNKKIVNKRTSEILEDTIEFSKFI